MLSTSSEQAFLATVKLKADGTRVRFSRDDHDSLHLFDRADRFLPNGRCLLPPLQACDKGNACLTCSVFVTDTTHRAVLQCQLHDTTELIERTTTAFQQRHGQPMPDDDVWLAHRRAEQQALTRLLEALPAEPGPGGARRLLRNRLGRAGPAHPRPHPAAEDAAMTDTRTRRTAVLTAAAKARSQAKARDADHALRRLVKRGEPITFQAVQREAGVSHALLYNHPELRQRIEHLRAQARPAPVQAAEPNSESTLVLALTQQITALKKQHRQEVGALRAALEQAHGENLDLRRELDRRGQPGPSHPRRIPVGVATPSVGGGCDGAVADESSG